MKVAVLNTVALNGGDAAILFAVLALVRDAIGEETEFVVFDKHPDVARRRHGGIDFRPMLWLSPASLREVARCDLAVSTGGTYFVPTYRLWPRAFEVLAAARLGKAPILFPQSIGAYERPLDRFLLRRALTRSRCVLLRDEASRRNVLALGVPGERLRVVPDSVFGVSSPDVLARAVARRMPTDAMRVAISVRDWRPFASGSPAASMARFEGALRGLVVHLVRERHAEVLFLSTCQGIPEYQTDDSSVAAEIVEGLPSDVRERTRVDREFHAPLALQRILGEHDLVVATRMHAAILALAAGTPVLPLAYEFKTTELFEGLGMGDVVRDVRAIEGESLSKDFDRLAREIDGRRADLFARVGGLREAVRTAVREVLA